MVSAVRLLMMLLHMVRKEKVFTMVMYVGCSKSCNHFTHGVLMMHSGLEGYSLSVGAWGYALMCSMQSGCQSVWPRILRSELPGLNLEPRLVFMH